MGSKIQESARSPLIMLPSPPTSPTFNSCSSFSTELAQIAARVVQELSGHASEDASFPDTNAPAEQKQPRPTTTTEDPNDVVHEEEEEEKHKDDDDDEEFEFSFVCGEPDVTADEIFHNGQIRPLYYPLFNTDLLLPPPPQEARKRLPLGKLFLRKQMDRETASSASCSSSEADELEGVPSGSYCVWNPKERKKTAASSLPGMRKKSNSTGSVSKRWKLKDLLLQRSSSEGKHGEDINSHSKNDNT